MIIIFTGVNVTVILLFAFVVFIISTCVFLSNLTHLLIVTGRCGLVIQVIPVVFCLLGQMDECTMFKGVVTYF